MAECVGLVQVSEHCGSKEHLPVNRGGSDFVLHEWYGE